MTRTAFYGNISTPDAQIVRSLLETWLDTQNVKAKLKLTGNQFVYEDERIYVYCYNADAAPEGHEMFLLEGNTADGLDETRLLLQRFRKLCEERDLDCDLEYVALDESGDQAGDMIPVR
jgi:hypothetical protein